MWYESRPKFIYLFFCSDDTGLDSQHGYTIPRIAL